MPANDREKLGTVIGSALGAVLCLSLSGSFAYAFYVRYWKWRECIAVVESSCTEPGAWNATEGGMVWAIPAVFFLGIALVFCVRGLVAFKGVMKGH